MKLITAFVRPFTLEKLIVAFESIDNFPGVIETNVESFGSRLQTPRFDSINPFGPMKKIEIACDDEMADEIIEAIRVYARTGKKGDGIITVVATETAVYI